jgi:hypothetical protein
MNLKLALSRQAGFWAYPPLKSLDRQFRQGSRSAPTLQSLKSYEITFAFNASRFAKELYFLEYPQALPFCPSDKGGM